jgi:hypothetical protein
MPAARSTPSPADVAMEVNGFLAGLGVLSVALFPFALPGLLLGLLLVLPVAPLVLAAAVVWLLARAVAAAFRFARSLVRRPIGGAQPHGRRRRPPGERRSAARLPSALGARYWAGDVAGERGACAAPLRGRDV